MTDWSAPLSARGTSPIRNTQGFGFRVSHRGTSLIRNTQGFRFRVWGGPRRAPEDDALQRATLRHAAHHLGRLLLPHLG